MNSHGATRFDRGAILDRDMARLRHHLDMFLSIVSGKEPTALEEFDSAAERLIGEVFGSSSEMLEAYAYAELGEAAGWMNLPEEAQEAGAQDIEKESLQQRKRVLERCIADLEARRAAAASQARGGRGVAAQVAGYMSREIKSIQGEATLKEAGTLLEKLSIGALLVREGEGYIGIISEIGLAKAVVAHGLDPSTTLVRMCMRKPLVTIEAAAPVIEAVRLMREKTTRYLVVTEDGRITGILSASDVLRYYAEVP